MINKQFIIPILALSFAAPLVALATTEIRSLESNKCIQVTQYGLVQYRCRGDSYIHRDNDHSQKFEILNPPIVYNGAPFFQIRVHGTASYQNPNGSCLDVTGSNTLPTTMATNFCKSQQNPGMENQFFAFFPSQSAGYYEIRPLHSLNNGQCLEVEGSSSMDDTQIVQNYCRGTRDQLWHIGETHHQYMRSNFGNNPYSTWIDQGYRTGGHQHSIINFFEQPRHHHHHDGFGGMTVIEPVFHHGGHQGGVFGGHPGHREEIRIVEPIFNSGGHHGGHHGGQHGGIHIGPSFPLGGGGFGFGSGGHGGEHHGGGHHDGGGHHGGGHHGGHH